MSPPLVLSLFPGIGLLDMAFEAEGFCVVRGPDLLWGGDIKRFHPPAGRFDGVIGGPPCQLRSTCGSSSKMSDIRTTDSEDRTADPTVGPWKCFFCGEVFRDGITAGRHFGEHEGCTYPVPGCVDPLRRDEKARLHELQLARWRPARHSIIAKHCRTTWTTIIFNRQKSSGCSVKGRRTAHQAFLELDSMEGRALAAEERVKQLRSALERSVNLQSHYASLLNVYDGGKRMQFADADAWLARLASLAAAAS